MILWGFIITLLFIPVKDTLAIGTVDVTDLSIPLMLTGMFAKMFQVSETFTSLLPIYIAIAIIVIGAKIMIVSPLMDKAHNSMAYSVKTLEGRTGTVITPIVGDKMGEIMVGDAFGRINKMAKIYQDTSNNYERIEQGTNILIVEMVDNIAYVIPYESIFLTR